MLWIDDDTETLSGSARLLELEGYRVDQAGTGRGGLALARTHAYDLILLDLRLPDMEGVTVLQQLRREQVMTSVLVLTGFATIAAAAAAMRLGAADFREKPLIGDDLVRTVRGAIDSPVASRLERDGRDVAEEGHVLREMLALLNRLVVDEEAHASSVHGPNSASAWEQLVVHLVRVVVMPGLSIPTFVACAQSLRSTVLSGATRPLADVVEDVRGFLERAACRRRALLEPRLVRTVRRLETTIHRARLSEKELADEFGVDPSHLGRLLHSQTGLTFRQWRWGAVIQHAVRHLYDSREQVAQIAYRLGYQHAGQFDREFHQLFGFTPKTFRRLVNGHEPTQHL